MRWMPTLGDPQKILPDSAAKYENKLCYSVMCRMQDLQPSLSSSVKQKNQNFLKACIATHVSKLLVSAK